MMTTTRKSFLVSLVFHTLMGSLAFAVLTQMSTPPPMVKIPLQHMMLVSLSHSKPAPEQPKISKPIPVVTPHSPAIKRMTTQPITPKTTTQSLQTPQAPIATPAIIPTPVVSTPQLIQHTVQTPTAPIAVASKPKIDIASEKRAFFSSLRSNIQRNLRYPSAARRRGMEGEVGVRFTLLSNGEINGISVQRGEGIFHNAAIAAVTAASGIDIPKNLTDTLPMEIDLTLEFKLNS